MYNLVSAVFHSYGIKDFREKYFSFFFLIGLSLFTDLQKDIVSCLSYITDLLENTWFQNSFVLQVMGRARFGDT